MKRLLVIANEPFSDSTSNGRTMKNLLQGYDKTALAQFYLHGTPDTNFCQRYYRVSDRDALNAFLHRRPKGAGEKQGQGQTGKTETGKKIPHTCCTMVLRDLVWSSYAWWDAEFERFLQEFAPEVILLQAGDAPFMFALAQKIARRLHVPLLQFNTENYVLKRYMYNGAKEEGIWHTLLQQRLKRRYASFMKQAAFCVYSMEQLEEDYQAAYPHPGKSTTLYTVSELIGQPTEERRVNEYFRVVYCGNLGVGRAQPLAELAQILHEVDPQARLELYGRFVKEEDRQLVCGIPSVDYRGTVDYSAVPGILRGADMIVHCENAERLENLRTAFSTKIADSLAVGTPFLVYADKRYPFVKYLLKHQCAHVAGDREELSEVLTKCRYDAEYREQYLANAQKTALEQHSAQRNCCKMIKIINKLAVTDTH